MRTEDVVRWVAVVWTGMMAYLIGIPQPVLALVQLMFLINLPIGYVALVFKKDGGLTKDQFIRIGLQKVATLLFLAGAHLLEPALNVKIHIEEKLGYLFLGHEALAMIRYATAAGVKVPDWLAQLVDRFVESTEPAPKLSVDAGSNPGN